MTKTAANAPVTVVPGGDSYLNDARTKALCAQALKARPDADLIELDAASADQYAFDEAVSPSLLSDVAVVKLVNLQNADDKLAEALVAYTKQAAKDPNGSSVVICQHEGGVKGRKIIDQLVKAGARKEDVPDLKKPDAQLNFVLGEFEKRGRRVEPMAAQQLVSVLGGKTGELAAMCEQLCFDFDDNPMGLDRVNQYLTANPQVIFGQSYLDHMRCLEDVGMLSTTPVNFNGQEIVPIQFLKALLPDPASLGPRTKGKTNIGCIFTGKKDGKDKTYYIYNVCDHQECYKEVGSQAISYTTGVPAMCGALMLLTGKWTTKGVHTVEEFDPDPYLDALDKYGLPRSESHNPALVD